MAGRPGVTRAEVAAAVQVLRERGERVSAAAVRGQLRRGSFTTIGKHLRDVRAEEDALSVGAGDGRDLILPDPIARSLVAGAEGFWLQLSQAADAIVEEAELRARERIAAAQAMEQAARRDAEAVGKERDALAEAREALSVELEDLRRMHAAVVEQLRNVIGEREQLMERVAGVERLCEERGSALDHGKALIAELRAEAVEVGRRVDAERKGHEAAVSELRLRFDAGVAELAAAALEREALQAELRGLREALAAERSIRGELESSAGHLQRVLGEAREARSQAEAERSEFAARCEVLERSVERLDGVVSGYSILSRTVADNFERVIAGLSSVSSRVDDVVHMGLRVSIDGSASIAAPQSSPSRENE